MDWVKCGCRHILLWSMTKVVTGRTNILTKATLYVVRFFRSWEHVLHGQFVKHETTIFISTPLQVHSADAFRYVKYRNRINQNSYKKSWSSAELSTIGAPITFYVLCRRDLVSLLHSRRPPQGRTRVSSYRSLKFYETAARDWGLFLGKTFSGWLAVTIVLGCYIYFRPAHGTYLATI